MQLCVTQEGPACLPLCVTQEGLARLPFCVTYLRDWHICRYVLHKDWHACHYVLHKRDWHACHYMFHKRGWHVTIMCCFQETDTLVFMCYTRGNLHEEMAHWPACFTQEGDWNVCQYVLLSLFTIMHYSTGMLAIRCCLSGSCVLAIMHFWHACNVLLNRLACICLPTI